MPNRAHDMSRFWRIYSYQHGRVNGTFVVHGAKDGAHHVKPYDVTVYADDSHSWGRVLRSDDLTAFHRDGAIDIPAHMIREAVRSDVEDAFGDLVLAVADCIAAYESTEPSPTQSASLLERGSDAPSREHTTGGAER